MNGNKYAFAPYPTSVSCSSIGCIRRNSPSLSSSDEKCTIARTYTENIKRDIYILCLNDKTVRITTIYDDSEHFTVSGANNYFEDDNIRIYRSTALYNVRLYHTVRLIQVCALYLRSLKQMIDEFAS